MTKNFSPDKPKRGRPAQGKRREYRLSDQEYARLQAAARKAGITIAELSRRAILAAVQEIERGELDT